MLPDRVLEILNEMKAERIRGATWLARKGAEAFLALAEELDEALLEDAIRELRSRIIEVNPSMASLYNLARFMPITNNRELVKMRALEFLRRMDEAKRELASIGAQLIDDGDVIITHSFSSSVLEIFKVAKDRRKSFKVIITESSPDYEGLHLANELENLGIEFEVITDSQMGLFCRKATISMVGADMVTRDGFVVNKAGTYLLALACHESDVPFYVAAETYKFHPTVKSNEVVLHERDFSRSGFRVRNVLFDLTPWKFIRGIITELGIVIPPRDIQ
ncbi:translation initiation factor eIF-2B alpha/beta/delta subunit family protein [Pyrococcus abyssi]|uniref:Putative translation initiation factor eIF-2B subunit 2-like n=1 Tax=Pyrococcus abyssi (strain GE5 / Orsay) TaxID=272844 RepID=EI2BL_PYRAB|nr:translation initiation factor IF-2 [Pyrococcus abyssi]Q9UYB6.1 RecName: Full=Putative translation initiation factor eIF-2B subunit 2-like; AltName: Full=eIF-2B GDP-GTP exchange factor [Pyrococcus abyssi GE5]CAB50496.1 Putative translation initiation factor eIF-2B delta subunit [Pyrococcus abyssi GE5]CCE71051.1 TPA: translation initiation factor IF-2B subunit alpha [Pyrococcus abyssi GE5]